MKKASIWIIILVAVILFMTSIAHGQVGLSVSPAEFTANVFTFDKRLDTVTLLITNTGVGTQSYVIGMHEPLALRAGYSPLPEEGYVQNWVTFDKTRITLGPGESGEVKVFLEIPNEKQYHVQKWETWINVEGTNAGFIGAEVFVRMKIETAGEPPSILDHAIMFIREEAITIASIGAIIACVVAGVYVLRKKFEIKIRRK